MAVLDKAWGFIEAGGPVMWPLLALSLWMWALIIVKAAWLVRAGGERVDLGRAVAWLKGDEAPLARPEGLRTRALALFLGLKRGQPRPDRLLWESAVRHQVPTLNQHVGTILVLAAVAPLLGLLGTVTGMIGTFRVINAFGTGNAQALAAGIKEALITTQLGLMVAIPGLFAGYTLRRHVRRLLQEFLAFHQAVDRWLRGDGEDV